ncbi:MAG TPA: protein kinase [Bacteroidota bacterium]|jgi:serine/threonine-protein kinase|nr:protein kinase [Bacteroidota bacterium]
MIGQTISQYKILEKLGEGGMGVVYKAHDTKLDRIVALKFLPHHLTTQEAEQARFLQEARAASALNHPNVCTIYDIKEEGDQQYIVMELVDGTTLKHKLPIQKESDVLAYALQIGDALHEAHSKGIVHRDIKCENIMVNSKNQIKVMDFGLAKLKGTMKLTKTSSTVGTLAYMAPEQIQGAEVDGRSDIFSFGVVLFEMLTGRMPFRGEHEAAMMYSILHEEPESVAKSRPDVSPEIDRIIRRALEKDSEDRYQHIDDMVSELRRIQKKSTRVSRASLADIPAIPTSEQSDSASTAVSSKTQPIQGPSRRGLVIGAGVVVLLVAGAAVYFSLFRQQQSIDSIAILPFTNVGADPNTEYLSDGITESIINSLSQIPNLKVMSRSSVFHYKGKESDPQKAGKELGVKAVLVGRVTQRTDNLLISAELVDVSNNTQMWGEQFNKKLSDVISVQEDISKEISHKLSLKLASEDEKKLVKRPTENTEAYQFYLKGRFYWNKRKADDLWRSVKYYQMAIDADPNYALAQAGLASTYVILPEYTGVPLKEMLPKIEAAAKRATELDPTLAEPFAVRGLMKNSVWDWSGAEEEFKKAIELNPGYPTSYHWYSILLRQQGKFEEALAKIKRGLELDPMSMIINLNYGDVYAAMGRYDQAIDVYKKLIELDPNFPGAHRNLADVYLVQNNPAGAITELKKVREIVGTDKSYGLEYLGYAYGRSGKIEEAEKVLDQLVAFSKGGNAVSFQIAAVYAGMGENDKAFDWLEKGYVEQNSSLAYLKITPFFAGLKSDPRYIAMLKKLGLEK